MRSSLQTKITVSAILLAIVIVFIPGVVREAAARSARDLFDLENLTLDAENDPPNMRMKIYARFRDAVKYSGDIDFIHDISTEKNPTRGEETFTYSFQKSSERSVNFFSINTKVPAVYIIRGKFKCGEIESEELSFTYAISGTAQGGSEKRSSAAQNHAAANFDSFWEKTMAEIDQVNLNEVIELDPVRSNRSIKVFNVSYRSLDGVTIYGYLYYPVLENKNKKMPGMLFIHGYNMIIPEPFIDYCFNMEVAVLQIELRGCGRSAAGYKLANPEYILNGIDDPETFIYKGVVADCICGTKLLQKMGVVDNDRIVLNGGSQGAGLALITAGLLGDSIAATMADEPFMCNFKIGVGAAESGPYKKLRDHISKNPQAASNIYKTLSYFDAMNFAENIKSPVYISVGGKDTICPPATIEPVIRKIRAPKEVKSYSEAAHDLRAPAYLKQRFDWLKKTLAE